MRHAARGFAVMLIAGALTAGALCAQDEVATAPALRDLRPDLPLSLSELLRRCLAKSRHDRPASAAELERALMRVRT